MAKNELERLERKIKISLDHYDEEVKKCLDGLGNCELTQYFVGKRDAYKDALEMLQETMAAIKILEER